MIVITGASDGLGLQLAKLYQDAGKKVINISRRESEFADVNISCDLTDYEDIKQSIKLIEELPDKIEALINCAGVLSIQKLGSIDYEEVESVMKVNVQAPIQIVSSLFERIKNDKTDIVNVSSTVGTKAYTEQAAYGSSKWAMRGFSANLQVELKDTNRVISFCPGGFESRIFEKATGITNQDFTYWMKPEDLAKFMKQILDLPKSMEVSEVIINRKAIR